MVHGTGDYRVRIYKADLENSEYCAIFTKTRHYYYEDMSDCYEPTWYDKEDGYEATVLKWRKDRYGHLVADHISEGYRTGDISKEEANKIWWNIKNNNISFDGCRKYFRELAGKEIKSN